MKKTLPGVSSTLERVVCYHRKDAFIAIDGHLAASATGDESPPTANRASEAGSGAG
jgi:hypothetical protein